MHVPGLGCSRIGLGWVGCGLWRSRKEPGKSSPARQRPDRHVVLWIGSGEERIHPVQRLRIIAYPFSPPTRLTFIPLCPTFVCTPSTDPCPRIRTSKPRSVPRPHPRSSFRISHCFRVLLCAPLSHNAAVAVSPVGPMGLPSALPVSIDPSPMSQPVPVSRLWLTCFGITQSLIVISNHLLWLCFAHSAAKLPKLQRLCRAPLYLLLARFLCALAARCAAIDRADPQPCISKLDSASHLQSSTHKLKHSHSHSNKLNSHPHPFSCERDRRHKHMAVV